MQPAPSHLSLLHCNAGPVLRTPDGRLTADVFNPAPRFTAHSALRSATTYGGATMLPGPHPTVLLKLVHQEKLSAGELSCMVHVTRMQLHLPQTCWLLLVVGAPVANGWLAELLTQRECRCRLRQFISLAACTVVLGFNISFLGLRQK